MSSNSAHPKPCSSRQDLIVPPRDKARFRASNEAESSCSALIPRLRAPKRSYVTTRYGCHGRSARRTPFLFLLTLNGAPPTSIPSRDICIGPQSMHQFLLSTLYTAASADHRRSTSDLLSPNALSISELQRNRTVGHQVIVTISGVCCLCEGRQRLRSLFTSTYHALHVKLVLSPPISCNAEDGQLFVL